MKEYLSRNREGLGVNILATGICGLVVYGFWQFNEAIPEGWRTAYWIGAIVIGVLGFILFFVPFGSRRTEPVLPQAEADLFPLSQEAEHILRVTVKDDFVTFLGTLSFGQKGTRYNAQAVDICD